MPNDVFFTLVNPVVFLGGDVLYFKDVGGRVMAGEELSEGWVLVAEL